MAVQRSRMRFASLRRRRTEPFIAGGAEILRAGHASRRPHVPHARARRGFAATRIFPEFDDVNEWQLIDREHFEADEKNDYPYSFLTYDRVAARDPSVAEEG